MNVNSIQPTTVQKHDNIKKAAGAAVGIAAAAGAVAYLAKTGKLDTFVSTAKEKISNINSDSIKRKFGKIQKAVQGATEKITTSPAFGAVKEKAKAVSDFAVNKFTQGVELGKGLAGKAAKFVSGLVSKVVKH